MSIGSITSGSAATSSTVNPGRTRIDASDSAGDFGGGISGYFRFAGAEGCGATASAAGMVRSPASGASEAASRSSAAATGRRVMG